MRLCCAIAALLAGLSVQDSPRQVFRSGVDLVTIDAIVLDREGRPVTDLVAGDFTVTANKRRRRVVSALYVAFPPASGQPIASAEEEEAAVVSSNSGLFERRSFLFVVDVDQIRLGDGRVALQAASEFIASLPAGDLAGVVALPHGHPRVDLTTDRQLPQRALAAITGASRRRDHEMSIGEAAQIDRNDMSVVDAWHERHRRTPCSSRPDPTTCLVDAQRVASRVLDDDRRRSRVLFDALRALADAMRPLSGLKTIVLISEGMVRDRELSDDLRRFAEAAAASRVTLHSLALDIPQTEGADGSGRPPDRSLDADVRVNGLAEAALAAGGELFHVSGTPRGALEAIDAQLGGYYLVSFEADQADRTAKRKSIDVKVGRSGVRVRARTDFAVVDSAIADRAVPSDARARLGDLLRWPVTIREIGLQVTTFASPPAAGESERRVIVAADLPPATAVEAAGFEITDSAGTIVADAFDLAPQLAPAPEPTTYLRAVTLPPGHYVLKFGVLSGGGLRGSIQHPLWVKALPEAPVTIGDVVIGREDGPGFRPLAHVPTGLARLAVRVEVQATDAAALEKASVVLEILRPGRAAPVTSATMAIERSSRPLQRLATAAVALGRLAPGEYILRCTVHGAPTSARAARLITTR